jgi:ketopantoate hydroxymethyltransferase
MRQSVSVSSMAERKVARGSAPIVMVTAYDMSFAHIVDSSYEDSSPDVLLMGVSRDHTSSRYRGTEKLAKLHSANG